jgi:hypothetical protein
MHFGAKITVFSQNCDFLPSVDSFAVGRTPKALKARFDLI